LAAGGLFVFQKADLGIKGGVFRNDDEVIDRVQSKANRIELFATR
jgi:hypothetical protein